MKVDHRIKDIEDSMKVFEAVFPGRGQTPFVQTRDVHAALAHIEETREHRNEAYRRYWEYRRLRSEKEKIELEKEVTKVKGYPVSGLAKLMTSLGISMITATISAISISMAFYSNETSIDIIPLIGGFSIVFGIGVVIFINGIIRWKKDEKKQRDIFWKYVMKAK